jgi:hypothetical protein
MYILIVEDGEDSGGGGSQFIVIILSVCIRSIRWLQGWKGERVRVCPSYVCHVGHEAMTVDACSLLRNWYLKFDITCGI